jgi:conjugative relaxase-like TrwC/TraI family protein
VSSFSAPKSVSLLWGLGGVEAAGQVKAAHREAVGAALSYLQREACWTRRGAGGREFVKGSGFLAAAYVHRSSRNGDPQLHTHVLVANATKGPDGRWTRLYHPAIYEHAKTAGYLYEAHLRHGLTLRLGVHWQEVRSGIAEIEGFADSHLRAFSTRRAEILEAAGSDASAASMQVATLATRKPKDTDLSTQTLRQRWQKRAKEIGLDRETIERTFDPDPQLRLREPDAPRDRTVLTRQVDRAVTGGTSHFDRRDAIQAVAGLRPEGAPGAEVERMADDYLASEDVIQIAESRKGPRFTTRHVWELEREALAAIERMREQGAPAAGELAAARVIHARPTLKADQCEMVNRLLTRPEGIVVVIGEAGTGKTYAIVAAAEGWAQAGIDLRAAAPTWRAANVLRDEGLPATVVASLLVELDRAEHQSDDGLAQGSVLLIDEAGMVDSATLARLVHHAEAAEAKLVLLGDPEQLGEIEAGGLFRAVADRSEMIHLDEVIRHEHELDREAAKLIREGEGGEALGLYVSEERVTVAPDAEARREAMVRDWLESYRREEDAVMIAKRNAEVAKLNAMARETRKQEGKLGAQEIEVGEARFAAGDQVITRVNDQRAEVFNRERWRIAEVDAEQRRIVLEGIDQAKRIEVGAEYLARTNPHSEAPALEPAYAVTTYSAQGATVDRAYVMADPSMDKQELYVAASRARGETFIYATPEVRAQREEIAPTYRRLAETLDHIAQAVGRDGAQRAAHDEAQLEALPTAELSARREELAAAARREASFAERRSALAQRIEDTHAIMSRLASERQTVKALPPRKRDQGVLARIEASEGMGREALARYGEEMREFSIGDAAQRELIAVDRVLASRRQLAITATRIAPPPYITAELGERPGDVTKQRAWDRGVTEIEAYRQEHGIADRRRAFGTEPSRSVERQRREAKLRRLREVQRRLGREQHRERTRELRRGFGIVR